MRNNSTGGKSRPPYNISEKFYSHLLIAREVCGEIQERYGRCSSTYAITEDYERKAKGFSAVAMSTSMPFFSFPTKTGK